jgi:hypothetical protein
MRRRGRVASAFALEQAPVSSPSLLPISKPGETCTLSCSFHTHSRFRVKISRLDIRKDLFQEVLRESRTLLISNLEPISSAVIGIIDFFCLLLPSELSKEHYFCFSTGSLMDSLEIAEVVTVLNESVDGMTRRSKLNERDLLRNKL